MSYSAIVLPYNSTQLYTPMLKHLKQLTVLRTVCTMRRFLPVYLLSLVILSCFISDTGDGNFLITNNISSYPLLIDIGSTEQAYCFKLKNSLWELYAYRYGTVTDTVDTVLYQTDTTAKSLCISSWTDGSFSHRVDVMYVIAGNMYLITDSYSGAPSKIYSFDTITGSGALLYADSALQLKSLGADSAYIYFSTVTNTVTCFNTSTSLFEDCTVSLDNFFPSDSILCTNGYTYVRGSSTITKMDTALTVTVWKTDSLFCITDMVLLDDFLYVCGYDGYESSDPYNDYGNYDPTAAKIDPDGIVLWQKNYETNMAEDEDILQKIMINTTGTIICIGNTGAWHGNEYFYLLTLDTQGNVTNERIFSNNTTTISDMDYIDVQSVPGIEENTLHVLFQAQIETIRNYYAQITF